MEKSLASSSHWNSAAAERPGSLEESLADFRCISWIQEERKFGRK